MCWLIDYTVTSAVSRKLWGSWDNDWCARGEAQTMSHIVNDCPQTKFDVSLHQLHMADKAAVDWLMSYIACETYDKVSTTFWSVHMSINTHSSYILASGPISACQYRWLCDKKMMNVNKYCIIKTSNAILVVFDNNNDILVTIMTNILVSTAAFLSWRCYRSWLLVSVNICLCIIYYCCFVNVNDSEAAACQVQHHWGTVSSRWACCRAQQSRCWDCFRGNVNINSTDCSGISSFQPRIWRLCGDWLGGCKCCCCIWGRCHPVRSCVWTSWCLNRCKSLARGYEGSSR